VLRKWQVVENVVAALELHFNKVPGTRVVQKGMVPYRNNPKRRREIDIVVEIPSGPRLIVIGVEVKCERAPLDVVRIEQLEAKFSKVRLDRCCVVSVSGFTDPARADAERAGLELFTLEELKDFPKDDFRTVPFQWTFKVAHFSGLWPVAEKIDPTPLIGKSTDDIELETDAGVRGPLAATLLEAGKDLLRADFSPILAQEPFGGQLDARAAGWRYLHIGSLCMPAPEIAEVVFEPIVEFLDVSEAAFRSSTGLDVHGAVWTANGAELQASSVCEQREGGMTMTVRFGPAQPRRTKVTGSN
jgi:hypothetical protein